jgi:uncharacterized membrane protein (DUF106 family)
MKKRNLPAFISIGISSTFFVLFLAFAVKFAVNDEPYWMILIEAALAGVQVPFIVSYIINLVKIMKLEDELDELIQKRNERTS